MPAQDDDQKVGQRKTVQRDVIVQVIEAAPGPLTANEIHEAATRDLPNLGVATVYRTIKLLLDAELVHQVILPDGQNRYESAALDHHHHFRCEDCQQVFDLPGCMLKIDDGTSLPNGFLVKGHEITFYGLCRTCSGD